MERVRLKVLSAILLVALLYTVYPAPFITSELFWGHKPFSIACSIGSALIFITSITNNLFLVVALSKSGSSSYLHGGVYFGSSNYLIVMMCLADIAYTTFHLPFVVVYTWMRQLNTLIDYDLLMHFFGICSAFYYSAAGVSVASFTVACVQRLSIMIWRMTDHYTSSKKTRSVVVVSCLVYGSALFAINEKLTGASDLGHLLNSVFIVFFPVTVQFVVLAVAYFYKEVRSPLRREASENDIVRTLNNNIEDTQETTSSRRSTRGRRGRHNLQLNNLSSFYAMFCLYFTCWVPFVTVSIVHMYDVGLIGYDHYSRLLYVLPALFSIKSPLNLPLLLMVSGCNGDRALYNACVELLPRFCRGKAGRHGFQSRALDDGEQNNNGQEYSELQEFHLSASRVDMYSEQAEDQNATLVQYYV